MIIFDNIHIEGFASIVKPLTFKLNQPGLNIIRGKVGSGKTTIPSAFSWCLFGITLKGKKSSVATWEEIREDKYFGTKVEVEFSKEGKQYKIIRCLSYKKKVNIGSGKPIKGSSNTFIIINGELYTKERNKKDQQKFINELLGYSFELFKNTIVFGQKMKRIIEETGPDKKKVFEEGFDIGFISEAKNKAKDQLDKIQAAADDIENKIEKLVDKIEDKQETLKDALENEENWEKSKKDNIKELKEEIAELQKSKKDIKEIDKTAIDKIDKKLKAKRDSRDSILSLKSKKKSLDNKIDSLNDEFTTLKKVIKKKPKLCPSCNQPLSQEGYDELKLKTKKEIKKVTEEINHLKHQRDKIVIPEIDSLEKDIKKLSKKRDKLKAKVAQAKQVSKQIKKDKERLEKLNSKLEKLKNEKLKVKSPKYKKQISKLKKKLKKEKKSIKTIREDIDINRWLIKDPLSNNGLKMYMFNSLLQQVNQRLEEYSKVLGFLVEFGIDMDSSRKDFYQAIMKDGIVINYIDLSGGQKQLVDTTIAFAIHDVISSIRPTNILFLDEPFESLGMDEIEVIEELVEEKSKNKALFLITHHLGFSPQQANEITIKLNKKKHTKILN